MPDMCFVSHCLPPGDSTSVPLAVAPEGTFCEPAAFAYFAWVVLQKSLSFPRRVGLSCELVAEPRVSE
jgi:hypothetical protein